MILWSSVRPEGSEVRIWCKMSPCVSVWKKSQKFEEIQMMITQMKKKKLYGLSLFHIFCIMCYISFLWCEFSRLQNWLQAVKFILLILEVFYWLSKTENGSCIPLAFKPVSRTLMPCPDHLLSIPALSVSKPFIFQDKVSLLDKAFVAHYERFFSNVTLDFSSFM